MEENKKYILAALVVIFGGNATGLVNAFNPNIRADPFTGLMAQQMKTDLRDEMHLHLELVDEETETIKKDIHLLKFQVAECFKRLP